MRSNALHAIWADGCCAINAWLSIGSSYAAEVLAHLPYDAVTVDLQHGMFDMDSALTMLQAISTSPAVPMVRVPDNSPSTIQKVLDMGAYGVICPMIETVGDCEAFVEATRYPPLGNRSFGPARGLLYGGADYAASANSVVLSWAMIETARGLANAAEIVAVDGLSGVYIGPSDLSMALEGSIASPLSCQVTSRIREVIAIARANGVRTGVFCADAAFAREMIAEGCDLVTVMNDAGLLRRATAWLIDELKEAREERKALSHSLMVAGHNLEGVPP